MLRTLYKGRLETYRKDRQSAMKLLRIGESPRDKQLDVAELAAWTTVTSVIFNLDETLSKL